MYNKKIINKHNCYKIDLTIFSDFGNCQCINFVLSLKRLELKILYYDANILIRYNMLIIIHLIFFFC